MAPDCSSPLRRDHVRFSLLCHSNTQDKSAPAALRTRHQGRWDRLARESRRVITPIITAKSYHPLNLALWVNKSIIHDKMVAFRDNKSTKARTFGLCDWHLKTIKWGSGKYSFSKIFRLMMPICVLYYIPIKPSKVPMFYPPLCALFSLVEPNNNSLNGTTSWHFSSVWMWRVIPRAKPL